MDESGRAQARALAVALAPERFDHALCSDLSRAVETAEAIMRRHPQAPLKDDARLRELDFGSWEGLTWEEIIERYPSMASKPLSSPAQYVIDNGESFAQLNERVADVLADLRASSFENVLIVTHAGPLHALLHALPSEVDAVPSVRFEPASITRLTVAGDRANIVSLNDTAHLSPLPQR